VSDFEFSKVLFFCPHPDDAESMAGGSMARWASEGKEVVLCVVTNGAMGNNEPDVTKEWLIETRANEQRAAAEIMGLAEVIFLGYEDGYVEDNHELRRDLIREIRRYKPDVVMGPDPTMIFALNRYINHPDHRRLGEAVAAAINPGAPTLPLYRAELYDQGFEPHKPRAAFFTATTEPDYFVDITDFLDIKIKALAQHESPAGKPDEEWIRVMGKGMAGMSGQPYEYAEGFKALYFDG
jgi:LmbE family N-acetylglucosaminyl deacetylase